MAVVTRRRTGHAPNRTHILDVELMIHPQGTQGPGRGRAHPLVNQKTAT